jgi:hypothetical protein
MTNYRRILILLIAAFVLASPLFFAGCIGHGDDRDHPGPGWHGDHDSHGDHDYDHH